MLHQVVKYAQKKKLAGEVLERVSEPVVAPT